MVREKDVFDYEYGLQPRLVHKPSTELDPGNYTGAYAVIFYRDGSTQFDYMSIAEIEAIRARSSSPNAGPWVTDYPEMCKKTPLRRLAKLAPLSVEIATKLDEIDPEVGDGPAANLSPRDIELRHQLQAQLEREYGTAPAGLLPPGPTAPPANGGTTNGAPTGAQAGPAAAEGAPTASGVQAPAGQAAAAATTAAAPKPTAPTGGLCGATWEAMGAGPCALPAGHVTGPWHDADGHERKPQASHQQADGQVFQAPTGGAA